MGAKWFKGIIILAIVSLVYTLLTAPKRSSAMGEDIRNALSSAGLNAEVDMNGNVATLTGVAKTDDEMARATSIAENAECSTCKDNKKFFFAKQKRWHRVKNDMSVAKAPALDVQSPYTFNAQKDVDGNVVLDGYVRSEAERTSVLAQANALFPGKVTNRTVRIANGSPNADWGRVLTQNIDDLNRLDKGNFAMRDRSSVITGMASSADLKNAIDVRAKALANYDGSSRITLPGKTQSDCQNLINGIKTGKKISFAYNKADIRGAESFDLLNDIAAAAKECSSFRINVEGHTDADGSEVYNQRLSEARANTVVAYLTENGIARERMQAIGLGEAKPIGDNATNEGKAQNRRIEFVVTQSE